MFKPNWKYSDEAFEIFRKKYPTKVFLIPVHLADGICNYIRIKFTDNSGFQGLWMIGAKWVHDVILFLLKIDEWSYLLLSLQMQLIHKFLFSFPFHHFLPYSDATNTKSPVENCQFALPSDLRSFWPLIIFNLSP